MTASGAGPEPSEKPTENGPPRGLQIRWLWVVTVILAAAVGVLAYQNMAAVPVRALWWEFEVPLVVIVLLTAVATMVAQNSIRIMRRWRKGRARRPGKQRGKDA